jgi:transcriptional regulator with XRE-family HTH domain
MKSRNGEEKPSPREVLSANLRALMASSELTTIKKVAEASGTALSNGKVGRIYAASHTTDIDTLQHLANVFGLEPWQLLVNGLNPKALPRLADAAVLHEILDAVRGVGATPIGKLQPASAAHPVQHQSQPAIGPALANAMDVHGRKKGEAGKSGGVQKPRTRRRT